MVGTRAAAVLAERVGAVSADGACACRHGTIVGVGGRVDLIAVNISVVPVVTQSALDDRGVDGLDRRLRWHDVPGGDYASGAVGTTVGVGLSVGVGLTVGVALVRS